MIENTEQRIEQDREGEYRKIAYRRENTAERIQRKEYKKTGRCM